MLVEWQAGHRLVSHEQEVLCSRPHSCIIIFCIFIATGLVWDYDILDPHPAVSLDYNKFEKFNERD